MPGVERISARFHERRNARRSPFERAVMRLTGMDVKMEQYRYGERFVRAIAAAGGASALRRLWEGPESMPRDGEIAHPAAWLRRVMPRAGELMTDGMPRAAWARLRARAACPRRSP